MNERNYLEIMHQYCKDVQSGIRIAGKFEKLAVKRFLNDLKRQENDPEFPYSFNEERLNHVCSFIESLHHVKGKLARKHFILDPWQVFVVGNIFGWEDHDGIRRFTDAYIEISKKNGKSTLAAAIGLYMTVADGEVGAEVYAAAANYDQAKIVWEDAKQMVLFNPELQAHFGVATTQYEIRVGDDNSKFKPLATDKDGSKDGKNVHCGILDEIHAHKDSDTYDIIADGVIARTEPLILGITTAGSSKIGVCWRERCKVVDILYGKDKLERYFGIIFTIDKNDDWRNPDVWPKANPSMGIAFDNGYLKDKYSKIKTAAEESRFRQKSLNEWVQGADSWIASSEWELLADPNVTEEQFKGCIGFGGGDLASKLDLAGFVKWHPKLINGRVHWYLFTRQYINEHVVNQRRQTDGQKRPDEYLDWVESGHLIETPGNVTSFNQINEDIVDSHAQAPFYEFGFDPFNASQFAEDLILHGIDAVEVRQQVNPLSIGMRWMEELIRDGRLHHDGNPVLQWCICNIEVKEDNNNNIFPRKPDKARKIDAGVAAIIGATRAMLWDKLDVFDLVPGEEDGNIDDWLNDMIKVAKR
ncbi:MULTISPECIES: terminase large subunit [Acinetobacter]|uniref:Terminase large subunit n=1 Tax=Acinetobacter piscicola TaxID=2006115 RepID=A0A7S6VYH3_9GAMM|nr:MULTISPECIES: terminase TerL endonuclease subunit [Acinetobacter]QOW47249.1 terminase large subunit [Acinetobacter piscicola]